MKFIVKLMDYVAKFLVQFNYNQNIMSGVNLTTCIIKSKYNTKIAFNIFEILTFSKLHNNSVQLQTLGRSFTVYIIKS